MFYRRLRAKIDRRLSERGECGATQFPKNLGLCVVDQGPRKVGYLRWNPQEGTRGALRASCPKLKAALGTEISGAARRKRTDILITKLEPCCNFRSDLAQIAESTHASFLFKMAAKPNSMPLR